MIRKTRLGLAEILLAGTVAFGGAGCIGSNYSRSGDDDGTFEQQSAVALTVLSAGMSAFAGQSGLEPRQIRSAQITSDIAHGLASQQAAIGAAKAGRSEVNVNVYPGQASGSSSGQGNARVENGFNGWVRKSTTEAREFLARRNARFSGDNFEIFENKAIGDSVGLFSYNCWIDDNKNNRSNFSEIRGVGKRAFDLDRESINFALECPKRNGRVQFRAFSSDGKLVGDESRDYVAGGLRIPKILSKIKENGPGDYRITATLEDGLELSLGFRINRGSNDEKKWSEISRDDSRTALSRLGVCLKGDGYDFYRNKNPAEDYTILFTFQDFVDSDKSNTAEFSEFSGFGKNTFDLDNETMRINFVSPNRDGKVHFRAFTSDGRLLGETSKDYSGKRNLNHGYRDESGKDFLDIIKENGPGDYRVTATLEDGLVLSVGMSIKGNGKIVSPMNVIRENQEKYFPGSVTKR